MPQIVTNVAYFTFMFDSAESLDATGETIRFRGIPVERHWPTKALSTLSPKTATVALFGDCRRSPKSATI